MTISQDLQTLLAARSGLISSLASGEQPVLEYEIRGKKVKFESPDKMLSTLERLIKSLRSEVATVNRRASSRNRARLRR